MPKSKILISTLLVVLLAAGVAAAAVALTGGGDENSRDSQRSEVLSYFPKNSVLTALATTDPEDPEVKNVLKHVRKYTDEALFKKLEESLKESGLSYEKDIKPLLGGVAGFSISKIDGVKSKDKSPSYVAALWVKDAKKLTSRIEKEKYKTVSGADGAKYFRIGSKKDSLLSINGNIALVADSVSEMDAAIKRHSSDDHLTTSEFEKSLPAKSKDALLQISGDIGTLIAEKAPKKALQIPLVASIGRYGMFISVGDSGLTVKFKLSTDKQKLTADQMLLASDGKSATLAGDMPIRYGVRNLSHSINYVLSLIQAVSPKQYQAFQTFLVGLKTSSSIDLQAQLIDQFTGNTAIGADMNKNQFVLRSDLADAKSFTALLPKLEKLSASFGKLPKFQKAGADRYTLTVQGQTISFGVIDGKFVAGNVDFVRLTKFAQAPETKPDGLSGAVVYDANAGHYPTAQLKALTKLDKNFAKLLPLLKDMAQKGSFSETPEAIEGESTITLTNN